MDIILQILNLNFCTIQSILQEDFVVQCDSQFIIQSLLFFGQKRQILPVIWRLIVRLVSLSIRSAFLLSSICQLDLLVR